MSSIQPSSHRSANTSLEQQSLGTRFKNGCANIGNRIHQKYQHSTLVVALKTLLGKETVISKNGYHRYLGKYGETTLRKFWNAIKQDIKLTLVYEINAITWKSDGFSVETCPLDELTKLVNFTKLRIAKGKNDLCDEVNEVREYTKKFIEDLQKKASSNDYSSEQLQTDLQKLAIIKKICPQEAKECIKTLKNNHALRTLDNEIQERTKSLINGNGFVDLTACPVGELKKLVALARLREKKGGENESDTVKNLKEYFLNFVESLSNRMPSYVEKEERSRLAVIQKLLCADEVQEFMEKVREFKATGNAKTFKELLENEDRLW